MLHVTCRTMLLEYTIVFIRFLVRGSQVSANEECFTLPPTPTCRHDDLQITSYRQADGTCNNLEKPLWGAANTPFHRMMSNTLRPPLNKGAMYFDDNSTNVPLGHVMSPVLTAPTPHEVSRAIFSVSEVDNTETATTKFSALHAFFGQFLDHDITLAMHPTNVPCSKNPTCDVTTLSDFQSPCFPIMFPGHNCTPFHRTKPVCQDPDSDEPRKQVNINTAFIDGSQIYGNSKEKMRELQTINESGKMKMGSKYLLPIDTASTEVCRSRGGCFLAGDERVDENVALASLHTLFAREHNRIAVQLKSMNSHWTGYKVFQITRRIIGAILQKIVYYEYLPTLVDLRPYTGYNSFIEPSIINSFATAAFRFGHSEVPNMYPQLNEKYNPIYPDAKLQDIFMNNQILFERGIEPTVFGLMANMSQAIDTTIAHGMARKLFVTPGSGGFSDLIAINIQRGRDHGIPGYSYFREYCRLDNNIYSRNRTPLSQLHTDMSQERIDALQNLYHGKWEMVDLFAAGISERPAPGKAIGRTFQCIIRKQFEILRDGDRFYFENPGVFTDDQRNELLKVTLARVLCDNLSDIVSVHRDVFKVTDEKRAMCDTIPSIDLTLWRD